MTPEQIREHRDRKLASIRARRDITPHAKQVAIARAQHEAEQQMAGLLEDDTAKYHQQRDYLTRKFIGSTTDVTGTSALDARDARERAAKLDGPREAVEAFELARRDGDTGLMRAIAARAVQENGPHDVGDHWKPIVSAWAESTPSKADTFKELTELRQPNTGGDWSYALDTPSELGRLTAEQVVRTADYEVYGSGPEAA